MTTTNQSHRPSTCRVTSPASWGARKVRACCDSYGRCVYLWDDVAGHYTVCHSITAAQTRYVRAHVRWGALID